MTIASSARPAALDERLARYPLLDALIERRSRRFAKGLRLNGGPLAYSSKQAPRPLALEEQAALAMVSSQAYVAVERKLKTVQRFMDLLKT